MAGKPRNVVNPEFVHHLLPVFFDGFDADAQFGRDLLVGSALGDELKHLGLARSQVIRASLARARCRGAFPPSDAQAMSNAGAEEGASSTGGPNGLDQLI